MMNVLHLTTYLKKDKDWAVDDRYLLVDENNMPIEILASPGFCANTGDYTETSYYGGVTSVKWYKTGEHMTPQQWMQTYSTKGGWQRYCELLYDPCAL